MSDIDDAEQLALQAIDQIVQDAKRAMRPHMDNIMRLRQYRATPTPWIIPRDLGKSDAPLAARLLTDAPPAPNRAASPSYRRSQLRRALARFDRGDISGETLARTVAWYLENER